MQAVERLVSAGILPECAADTVAWYMRQGNEAGLERYVLEVESRQNQEVSDR